MEHLGEVAPHHRVHLGHGRGLTAERVTRDQLAFDEDGELALAAGPIAVLNGVPAPHDGGRGDRTAEGEIPEQLASLRKAMDRLSEADREAIAHGEEAMRLSPLDPEMAFFLGGIAIAHYMAGRFS